MEKDKQTMLMHLRSLSALILTQVIFGRCYMPLCTLSLGVLGVIKV